MLKTPTVRFTIDAALASGVNHSQKLISVPLGQAAHDLAALPASPSSATSGPIHTVDKVTTILYIFLSTASRHRQSAVSRFEALLMGAYEANVYAIKKGQITPRKL